MEGIVFIVIIAAVLLLLLLTYDKRKSIMKFFKEKVFKPKEIKIPKFEEKKLDTDVIPMEEKIDFGKVKIEESKKSKDKASSKNNDSIFNPQEMEEEEEDIDLDKIFEDLRIEQAKKSDRKFMSEMLDESQPNFDSYSMEDLDNLLEDKFSKGGVPFDYDLPVSSFNGNLTGEELGRAIKNLPPQLKILIASDILKRKF